MASFVVETYVPDGDQARFAVDVDGIRAVIAALDAGPARLIRSYLVPTDEMGFHVIEAASSDDVERIARLARVEVERVVGVIGVGPATVGQADPEEGVREGPPGPGSRARAAAGRPGPPR
jgi:hypothetical protein